MENIPKTPLSPPSTLENSTAVPPSPTPENTAPVSLPTAAKSPPPTPVIEKGSSGILPATKMTKKQLLEMRAKRKKKERGTAVIRNTALIVMVLTAGSYFWFRTDTLLSNPVLPLFGLEENTGRRAETLQNEKIYLKNQIKNETKQANDFEDRIKTKNYSVHTKIINVLKNQQLNWFDSLDENKKINFGLLDAMPRLEKYFNSFSYKDPKNILQGKPGQINLETQSGSRDGISFSATGSELFGRVFFLNIEFLQLANSFPFLKDGKLRSFSKTTNPDGDETMSFTVQLKRQKPSDEDPADYRFDEYLTWLQKTSSQE